MQQFFINARCVKSKTLTAALEAAYRSYIPSEKFPSCVLNIEIPAVAVDVNIHPAKLEVKFSNEKAVFDALYSAVRGTLAAGLARPELVLSGHGTADRKDAWHRTPTQSAGRGKRARRSTACLKRQAKRGAQSERKTPPCCAKEGAAR